MRIDPELHFSIKKDLAELRAKYDKALAFIKLIYNRRFISPITIATWDKDIESANELLHELEGKE